MYALIRLISSLIAEAFSGTARYRNGAPGRSRHPVVAHSLREIERISYPRETLPVRGRVCR